MKDRRGGVLLLAGAALALASCATHPVEPSEVTDAYCRHDGVLLTYDFEMAGQHACQIDDAGRFVVEVRHEKVAKYPINPSPWYAFQLESDTLKTVEVVLDYNGYKHRYRPWIKSEGQDWIKLDDQLVRPGSSSDRTILTLETVDDDTMVAGQPIVDVTDTQAWTSETEGRFDLKRIVYGQSVDERPLEALIYGPDEADNVIVGMTRQHPPETTGVQSFEVFVESLLTQLESSERQDVQVILFPMLNPDGVVHGHWRLNRNGVDTNRDWLTAEQPEINSAQKLILSKVKDRRIAAFIDFHSTRRTLVYAHPEKVLTDKQAAFPNTLKTRLETDVETDVFWSPGHNSSLGTSKTWALEELGVAGVTVELADNASMDERVQVGVATSKAVMDHLAKLYEEHE